MELRLKQSHIPRYGIVLFIVFYIIATTYYPGGSQADQHSEGFSWLDNYWCNLLSKPAINGQPNPARPIAIAAMIILGFSLTWFWYLLPAKMRLKKQEVYMMRISSILCVALSGLLLSDLNHDTVTKIISLCALMTICCTMIALYRAGWAKLFMIGVAIIIMVGLNNLLYYQHDWIVCLPLVQKITFAIFLIWIWAIDQWTNKLSAANGESVQGVSSCEVLRDGVNTAPESI